MPEYVLKVDTMAIQNTLRTLADLIADLDPHWTKVREELMGQGFVGVAYRNPMKEQHLKVLDAYLKEVAQEVGVMLQHNPGNEKLTQAMEWLRDGYADFNAAIRKEVA